MASRKEGAVTDPILATPPLVVAEATTDPHEHDWAGAGFTKPGPKSDARRYRAGYAFGKAETVEGLTRIFDGRATSFTDGYISGHRQMTAHLGRAATSRETEAGT